MRPEDDMQELYPLLAEAEVLVLAAPIYYFTEQKTDATRAKILQLVEKL